MTKVMIHRTVLGLLLLGLLIPFSADAKSATCKVIHFPLQHYEEMVEGYEGLVDLVAPGQYAVATFLSQNPVAAVVGESVQADETRDQFLARAKEEGWYDTLKEVFPQGLPAFAQMSPSEKEIFVYVGGVNFSLFVGFLDHAYSYWGGTDELVRFSQTYVKYFHRFAKDPTLFSEALAFVPEFATFAVNEREEAVVNKVTALCEKNPKSDKTILVVFGPGHDFTEHFTDEDDIHFERLESFRGVEFRSWEEVTTDIEKRKDQWIELKCGDKSGCGKLAQKALDEVRSDTVSFEDKQGQLRQFLIFQGASGRERSTFMFGPKPLTEEALQNQIKNYLDK